MQGGFINAPFTKYKDFYDGAKNHMASAWHRNAQVDASNFLEIRNSIHKNIVWQIDNSLKNIVDDIRKKLLPIISSIIFCGTHDISLRGKNSSTGNIQSL